MNQLPNLQSAIPAAIQNANKDAPMLITKPTQLLNLRRAIYNALKDSDEMVFPTEMKDHLQIFGYSPQGVENEMREMYKDKMLNRNKLKPFAYQLVKDCPVPTNEMVKIRQCNKTKLATSAQRKNNPSSLDLMSKLNGHISNLADLSGKGQIQYGYLGADIDLVTNHFSKLRSDCVKAAGVDQDVAEQYGLMGENIDQMIEHIKTMEKSIFQISQLAKVIRSNPL